MPMMNSPIVCIVGDKLCYGQVVLRCQREVPVSVAKPIGHRSGADRMPRQSRQWWSSWGDCDTEKTGCHILLEHNGCRREGMGMLSIIFSQFLQY